MLGSTRADVVYHADNTDKGKLQPKELALPVGVPERTASTCWMSSGVPQTQTQGATRSKEARFSRRVDRARHDDQFSSGRPIAIGADRVVQVHALEGKAPEYLADLGHIIDRKQEAAFQLRQPVSDLCVMLSAEQSFPVVPFASE